MAVKVSTDPITVYGITYKLNGAIKIPSSFTGRSNSEGASPSSSCSSGTYYYKAHASGDSVTYPYAISESSGGSILCWIKESVFPKATYTVKYSANGGSGAPSSQTKIHGTTLTLSSTKPTHSSASSSITTTYNYNYSGASNGSKSSTKTTSYTFSKWNTASGGGGTSYSAGGSYTSNAAVTLYAQWSSSVSYTSFSLPSPSRSNATTTYTVTYNANGGSCSTSSAKATKTTKYTFTKWNTKSNGSGTSYSGGATYKPTSNTTLYAQWSSSTTNGHVTLPTPTRTGYTFKGWATSSSASSGTAAGKTYTVTANVTLYATWAVNTGTLHYHPNGGSATSGHPLVSSGTYAGFSATTSSFNYTHTSGDFYNVGTLFSRTGYHVDPETAWRVGSATATTYFNQESQDMRSYAKTNGTNVKLYANWKANTYSIKYNANGGSGTMANSSHVYGTSKALTNNAFTRSGYTFIGWATSDTGAVKYANKASVSNLTSTNNGTVNLYAIWEQSIFTITFDAQDGTSDISSIQLTANDSLPDINPPYREGYNFGGYFDAKTGTGNQYYSVSGQALEEHIETNIILYAFWIPITYQVFLVDNDQTLDVDSDQDMPTIDELPIKAGYVFSGYFTLPDGSGVQYYDENGHSKNKFHEYTDVSLYAKWVPIRYTISFDHSTSDSGTMEDIELDYDQEITLPDNHLYKQQHFLKKWSIQGKESFIEKGSVVSNLTTINNDVVILQPVWQTAHVAYWPVQTSDGTYEWKLCYLYYGDISKWQPCFGKIGRSDHWHDTTV